MAVVYYNAKCPVCDSGIRKQRVRMPAAAIDWRDINCEPDALAARGIDIDAIRRKLHVIDGEGRLHVGADAFAALWRETPGWGWLGRLIALPAIRPLARLGYDGFADLLYRWNRRHGRW